ncbi:MAG: protein translocase subunit SecD [Dehalococcoidales bacterium]|nr:protein translocase subunit SecD [Dehalococcoidales bacterium]
MARRNTLILILIIAIFALTVWVCFPLRSSVELTYQGTFPDGTSTEQKVLLVDEAVVTMHERIEQQGIKNYDVEKLDGYYIHVSLSDYTDVDRAKQLIGDVTNFKLSEVSNSGEKFGRNLQLGLDLAGGVKLVYQVTFTDDITDQQAVMDRTILTIEKRIDRFGVTEPIIQQLGADLIMVQLPGFTDIESAKSLVEQAGYLEFREVEKDITGTLIYLKDYLASDVNSFFLSTETANRIVVNMDATGANYGTLICVITYDGTNLVFTDVNGNPVDKETLTDYGDMPAWIVARGNNGTALTGALLSDAQTNISSSTSKPEVDIQWNEEGAVIFDQIAARLYNPAGEGGTYSLEYVLGIFLDNNLISAPQLLVAEYGGKGVISGGFTLAGAQELSNLLKSGSLPTPLNDPVEEGITSASLGAEFIDMSWKAGLIGLGLVMLFMTIYYRLPGFISALALLFYGTLTLTVCKLWPVTLSLGSIGGIIVSMGIAVDANVLIFERMKEEFRAGRTLGAAIEAGFHRAWSAIWDSNMTTFIACIILYWLGSTAMHNAAVMGFAVTLFVGAIVSMFTAVLVTRTLLRSLNGTRLANISWLYTGTGGKKQ